MNPFRMLGIRPDETSRVVLLFCHYICVVAVTIAGKSVRDVYFLSRYEKSILPLMAVAAAIAVALVVAGFTRLERRVSSAVLLPAASVVFALSLASMHFHLEGWTIPALYVWMEVINVLTILQFWLLAAELVDSRQAKRLFPLIGGGGSIAAILIGPQLKPFSKAYGSDTLLWLVCALLLLSSAVALVTTRLPKVPTIRSAPSSSSRKSKKRLGSPYLQAICALVICAAVVSAIVDYQFKIISSSTLRTETDLVGFFGHFYAATGAGTLILQFVVASRAFQRFGVIPVMGVLPLSLGVGSLSVLLWPVLASAVFARFSDQTFRFTLHNGGLELLWLPVPPNRRREAKPFITGSLKSISEGAAGVGMFALLYFLQPSQLSYVALIFCGLWCVTIVRLRRLYVSELQAAIENCRLPAEDLEVSFNDAATIQVIDRTLTEGDSAQKLFALQLIRNIPLKPWRNTLGKLLNEGDSAVRSQILEIAARDPAIVTSETLNNLANAGGKDSILAIKAIGEAKLQDLAETVAARTSDDDPSVRAAALATLIKLHGNRANSSRDSLIRMLSSASATERAAALDEGGCIDGLLTRDMIGAALADPSVQVRSRALKIAAHNPDPSFAHLIIDCAVEPALFGAARAALAKLDGASVLPMLADRLSSTHGDARLAYIRVCRVCLLPATHAVLLGQVDGSRPAPTNEASRALLAVARQVPPPADAWETAGTRRADLTRTTDELGKAIDELPADNRAILLNDYLHHSIRDVVPALIRLAALARPDVPIDMCVQVVRTNDRARLPFVLELVDTLLAPEEREKVAHLFERSGGPRTDPNTARSGKSGTALETWLLNGAASHNEWLRAISIDYLLGDSQDALVKRVDWTRVQASPLLAEVLSTLVHRKPALAAIIPETLQAAATQVKNPMFTTLEKTILLKSVPLFEGIAGEELSRVAQIAEEVRFPAATAIFHDGDHGDCLYVIVGGSVRVHKGTTELAILGKGQSLGEMAVLDNSPRSADATTIDDVIMLKVGQEQFLETMQANTEIMQGVIRMLLGRLRKMDEKIATATR